MLRNRLLIMLGGGLLTASAALADDLGFVDCATHPDETQVYAKARKSQDVVGTVPCGERFKIVLYGFIFSEIQTTDGKVGFVFSNVVTVERGGGTLQARASSATTPSLSATSDVTKIPADRKPAPAQPRPHTVAPPTPLASAAEAARMGGATSLPEQPAAAPATPAPAAPVSVPAVAAQPVSDASATTAAAPAQPQPVPAQSQAAPAPTALPDSSAVLKQTITDAATSTPATGSPAPTQPPSAADAAPAAQATPASPVPADAAPPTITSNAAETAAPVPAAPAAEPAAQPQPAAAEPEPPALKSAKVKSESWEKPNPGAKSIAMVELYGGFSFVRTNSGGSSGTSNNMLGGMGSFGWNIKPWIQIVGDTSYNFQTVSGTKTVLYGNHYGPRYYVRLRNPWNITPFVEALFGGSRADVTASGSSGYTSSSNCFSYKIGGGIDMRTTKLFEFRLIDFDYYRTAFGSGVHQNNYSVSTGIVLRLFAGKRL